MDNLGSFFIKNIFFSDLLRKDVVGYIWKIYLEFY